MNKVGTVLSLVVIVGCASPDVSWAHSHVLTLPEEERGLLTSVEPGEFMGPVLRGEALAQRGAQPLWDWVSLTHTDPHHLFGSEPHYPVPYRNFQMPDGGAIMFEYVFQHP